MRMTIYFITPFPQLVKAVLGESILRRAEEKQLVSYNIVDLRQFGEGKYRQIDDYPFTKTVENIDDFISALDEMSTIKPNSTEVNDWLSINRWEDRVDKMFSMIDSTPESDIRILEALS